MIFFIAFIFIIGILILVHELGHFLIAKKAGVKVEEFAIGFPPTIWKRKRGETIYSIGAIPIGGFVKLFGEEGLKKEEREDPRSYYCKSPMVKIAIVSGGVISNFLLASFIFYFLLFGGGYASTVGAVFGLDSKYYFPFGRQENLIIISEVNKNSPAEKAGITPNSQLITANQKRFEDIEEFIEFIHQHKGEEVVLKLKELDTEKEKTIKVVPRKSFPKKEGPLGIGLRKIMKIEYSSLSDKIFMGFLHSFNLTHFTFFGLGHLIKDSFTKKNIQPLASAVAGPVGILAVTKMSVEEGLFSLLNLLALLSLTLALINFFPIPALDGGRILFIGIEVLSGRKISPQVENKINLIGFILLIGLMILVTLKDIFQFGKFIFGMIFFSLIL